ncbi:MAG: Colicin I receptor [Candidatus Ordinivivax streblomastigis]|uniref:Colicin I receptor n=1 Tax=Candidatus Ordinivivax streblomastigis TaxID=2540710 RepID=A0A5M8P269_9BACT|nr:MAG: Colicin I receptor [Candidatus Ordinivivax streblomastigis]
MKIKKVIFTSLLSAAFLINSALLCAQTNSPKSGHDANITGHVVDSQTKEHLPYITIAVKGTTIGILTDATGHYFLKNMPIGTFAISASSIGYKTIEKTIEIVPNTVLEVNFDMEEMVVGMDEVVVSATRNETKKQGAAIIVNVASLKLFEATASCNLAETMNFQPGLRVENNCGNCGTTQLRINGLEGQYSQMLLDSRPIFSSLAGMYGLEQLPVSMIERVEVVRGGGSALFGSSAIGGVVNIITKEPLRNSISLTNTTNFFDNGKTDMNTSLNGSFVSDDQKAGVYIFGMVKDREPYDRNGDGFSDIPKLNSETVGFRGYYKTSNYSRLTAEYHRIHEYRRGGNNFDNPPHEADIAEYLNHNINGGGLHYDWFTPGFKHKLGVYTSAQSIARNSYFAATAHTDNYGNTTDKTLVAGAQYTYLFDRCVFMPSEFTAGFEYNYNDLHDTYISLDRMLKQKTNILGSFVQNEWKTEQWGILVGARLDKHNLIRNAVFSPRATLRYSPSDKLGFRASYSSGYRAPQAYNEDLHIAAVNGELSLIELDANLKPEHSHSVSASTDIYHNFGRLQTNLLAEGFYTVLNDVFTLEKTGNDATGNLIYTRRNGSGAMVAGLNLEVKLGIPGIFDIQMGYTYQQSCYKKPERWSEQLSPQRTLFRAPDNYGYITTTVNIGHDFKASVFGNYTGSMLVQHTYNDEDMERKTPDFFDCGIKLSYNIHLSKAANFEVNGGVKNMFDSYQRDLDYGQGKDAAYVYGPSLPRMFFVGAKFTM